MTPTLQALPFAKLFDFAGGTQMAFVIDPDATPPAIHVHSQASAVRLTAQVELHGVGPEAQPEHIRAVLEMLLSKVDASMAIGFIDAFEEKLRGQPAIAHGMGMGVVAEGVETAEDLEMLKDMGCDVAQGFHIARPMPAADLEDWLGKKEIASLDSLIR